MIHWGTNDLRRKTEPYEIAKEIVSLVLSVKREENEVAISGIVPRKDCYNKQVKLANECLKRSVYQRIYHLLTMEVLT